MAFISLLIFLMQPVNPTLHLSKNQWNSLPSAHFRNATDGGGTSQPTLVKLKYDDEFLYVDFECHQNPFWRENTYRLHNTDMWNQEVFELFLAEGEATPTRYLELEINPNNALFIGWIDNPSKEAPEKCTFVPYEKAGIRHEVKAADDRWTGTMQIPWALIGGKKAEYRLNFYRIISLQSHPDPDWKCTPTNCAFVCWSPTLSGTTPRFHRPEAFGTLYLR
ncbi:MAG: carbohydrate-binding family 9-like protein [Spirosomataceae bacterium]